MKGYKPWTPLQSYLFPPSPHDWLPDDHLATFILDVVQELDISSIERTIQSKDARGTRPYPPQMMVGLLLYGYCVGVFSSRKLEKATHEDVAFRVICGGHHPDHTRISEFRRQHLESFQGLFVQVVKLCQKAGLVKLGHVAVDGTKVQANASKHKAMSYKRMKELDKRLAEEISKLLDHAEALDQAEDGLYGRGVRGDEPPEELRHRETRLKRLREAKKELEKEARQARTQTLREQAERAKKRAESHPDPVERKRAATIAQRRQESKRAITKDDDDEPPSFTTSDGLPKHRPPAHVDGTPKDNAQRNFTDPDSRLMESGGAFLQAYNCQVAADSQQQIIVAQAVTNQCADNHNLAPIVQQICDTCASPPDLVTADAGFWACGVPEAVQSLGTEAYISTERRKHWDSDDTITSGPPPDDLDQRAKMRHKLRTAQGRKIYARRKAIVEPVNGQIKEARGFRRFLLRGLENVRAEWAIVCAAHNLLKLHRGIAAA